MKKRSELFFSFILVPIDYMMLVIGFGLAFMLREGQSKPLAFLVSGHGYLQSMVLLLPIWIVLFALLGLYGLTSVHNRLEELGRIVAATLAGTMILIIIDFFTTSPLLPAKTIPIYGFLIGTCMVVFGRLVVRLVQRFLFRYQIGVYRVAILGKSALADQLSYDLKHTQQGYQLIANQLDVSGNIENGLKQLAKKNIDEIIVADTRIPDNNLIAILNYCESHHITYKFVPSIAGLYTARLQSIHYGDTPLLEVIPTPLEGWGRIIKRLMDVVLTTISVVILAPIMLIIAIIMKLTDRGPVIYKHKRLTRAGKTLYVYKFRTMKEEYCTGGKYAYKTTLEALASFNDPELVKEFKRDQKVKNDPRISSIGKFLRKTSLDELPQLFNILKGELSLVGPRPIIESELERYGKVSNLFLKIKPGLTGLWQVSGRSDVDYEERVKLDIYYIENWSLWMDIAILVKTVWVIIRGRNGY